MADLILWTVFLLFLAAGISQAVRCWRGVGRKEYRHAMAWAPLSKSAKNAMWRALPVVTLSFAILILGPGIDELILARIDTPRLESFFGWITIVGWFGSVVASFTVLWWNVPKFVVSPLYRREPGLVRLWRRRRSIRRLSASKGAS